MRKGLRVERGATRRTGAAKKWTHRLYPHTPLQRPPPPGLTAQEAALLRKIQRRAHYLDKGFSLCGIRFGWTAIIGLIPGAGDAADASLNYFLVLRPAKKGAQLPSWLVHKMLFNNVCVCGTAYEAAVAAEQ